MGKKQVDKRVFHPQARINRKTKQSIVFDEKARKEFLSGFRKRKLERKKKAQEEFEKQLKEEKKKIKQKAKETYKEMVGSSQVLPELEDLLSKEYEVDNTKVVIQELSLTNLAKENNWIGQNKVEYEEKEEENSLSDEESEIPGMELEEKSNKETPVKDFKFKSKKDINKILKRQATKQVQKSKAFIMKNKMEQKKNKKKALKKKNLDNKSKKSSKKNKRKN